MITNYSFKFERPFFPDQYASGNFSVDLTNPSNPIMQSFSVVVDEGGGNQIFFNQLSDIGFVLDNFGGPYDVAFANNNNNQVVFNFFNTTTPPSIASDPYIQGRFGAWSANDPQLNVFGIGTAFEITLQDPIFPGNYTTGTFILDLENLEITGFYFTFMQDNFEGVFTSNSPNQQAQLVLVSPNYYVVTFIDPAIGEIRIHLDIVQTSPGIFAVDLDYLEPPRVEIYYVTPQASYTANSQADNQFIVACFARNTLISTPAGSTPVQDLHIGDLILSHQGQAVPVKWIGTQRIRPAFGKDNLPVCISAGALGGGLPLRDLFVSPGHAMYLADGVLVDAKALINGTTIAKMTQWEGDVEYFHIETERHEIILAEGAPTETFVDNISRACFNNYAEYEALYPDAHEMVELDIPRISHKRQLPNGIRIKLDAVATSLLGDQAAIKAA